MRYIHNREALLSHVFQYVCMYMYNGRRRDNGDYSGYDITLYYMQFTEW